MRTEIFKERVALVTGGGSGIGRSLCLELARQGAKTIVADVNTNNAARVAAEITAGGGTATAMAIDVAAPEQVESVIQETVRRFGGLDFIFNNAGIALVAEMHNMDLARWRQVIDVNLMGTIYGTHYAYQVMVRQKSGHIINIASLGGLIPGPMRSAYITGKFGVVGLSLSLRTESSKYGVQVSVVCPGAVKTPIFQTAEVIGSDRQKMEEGLKKVRMMDPDEAARKILKGVVRNQGIILMDTKSQLLWRLFRLSPALYERLVRKITVAK